MKNDKLYYHFEDDLNAYPDAWCFVVWSARGKGFGLLFGSRLHKR